MRTEKILITGSKGLLGKELYRALESLSEYNITGIDIIDLDLSDRNSVKEYFADREFDIIIHTAANTNVDVCESDIELAYKVNTISTQNILDFIDCNKTKFVYISSTGIYGDYKTSEYTEFDEVAPTTIHHKSKKESEVLIRERVNSYLILRIGWLFGGDIENPKNFIINRCKEASSKDVMFSDPFQKGNPTYVKDVIKQLLLILKENLIGVYNCVGKNTVSRYEYVLAIIKEFGFDVVVTKNEKPFKRLAPVSKNESADNLKLKLLGLDIMNDWELGLKEYVNNCKERWKESFLF